MPEYKGFYVDNAMVEHLKKFKQVGKYVYVKSVEHSLHSLLTHLDNKGITINSILAKLPKTPKADLGDTQLSTVIRSIAMPKMVRASVKDTEAFFQAQARLQKYVQSRIDARDNYKQMRQQRDVAQAKNILKKYKVPVKFLAPNEL